MISIQNGIEDWMYTKNIKIKKKIIQQKTEIGKVTKKKKEKQIVKQ